MAQEFTLFENEERVIKQAEELMDGFSEHSKQVQDSLKTLAKGYRQSFKEQQRLIRLSDKQQGQLKKLTIELEKTKEELRAFNERLSERVEEELEKRKTLEREKEAHQAVLIQQTKLAELGNMIGAIAHQWKQPLNAIVLAEELLTMDFADGSLDEQTIKNHKQTVMKQIEFMNQTMSDFRNFYKPSSEIEKFLIAKEVRSIVSLLDSAIRGENISINLQIPEEFCIMGSPSEFKQVILNILNNSKDAFDGKSIKSKEVNISAVKNETNILISISDNAGGIPSDMLQNIFRPFVTTKGDNGTGIGLSLCKIIIEEKMNGTLAVENKNNGALFTITIPEAQQ